MHPVTSGFAVKPRISVENVFGSFIKAQLIKMITCAPAPHNISFPVHLNYLIINEPLVRNIMVVKIFMCEYKRISAVCFRLASRIIVSHCRALTLIIVMLSGKILRLLPRICIQLCFVKFPYYISVPVYLHQIFFVLI